jgi:putative addiction module killer protein
MRVEMTEIYRDWIDGLKDRAARARVQVRVDRVAHGNPGQYRILTGGVRELKSSQAKDIKTAIALEKQL